MTPEDLAIARAIIGAASPGPWLYSETRFEVSTTQVATGGYDGPQSWSVGSMYPHEADEVAVNGRFIAAAREGWPAAIDEVERLHELLRHERAEHYAAEDVTLEVMDEKLGRCMAEVDDLRERLEVCGRLHNAALDDLRALRQGIP